MSDRFITELIRQHNDDNTAVRHFGYHCCSVYRGSTYIAVVHVLHRGPSKRRRKYENRSPPTAAAAAFPCLRSCACCCRSPALFGATPNRGRRSRRRRWRWRQPQTNAARSRRTKPSTHQSHGWRWGEFQQCSSIGIIITVIIICSAVVSNTENETSRAGSRLPMMMDGCK